MIATSETRFTLFLSEQEYEDFYEAVEMVVQSLDTSRAPLVIRVMELLKGLPPPPSRTRED